MRVKPFAALRPPKNLVEQVASPPYDVLDSAEALAIAGDKSLLHITKPEIDFSPMLPDNDHRQFRRVAEKGLFGKGFKALLLCVCADYGRAYPVWLRVVRALRRLC